MADQRGTGARDDRGDVDAVVSATHDVAFGADLDGLPAPGGAADFIGYHDVGGTGMGVSSVSDAVPAVIEVGTSTAPQPGDADPQSPAGAVSVAQPPLGPGDDDPRSPAGIVPAAIPAPGPGTLIGEDPHAGFWFLAPPPAGPGDVAITRTIVRFPLPAAPAEQQGEE